MTKSGKVIMINMALYICDALSDLVPFIQFKKREKHPWRSATFIKVAGLKTATLIKVVLLHGCFSRFLNCTNGTKSCKPSHIKKSANVEIKKHTLPYLFVGSFSIRVSLTDTDNSQDNRGKERTIFIPLYHFHRLTNIPRFICNFICEMTIIYL